MILVRSVGLMVLGTALLAVGCGKKEEAAPEAAPSASAAAVAKPPATPTPVATVTATAVKVDTTADANAVAACCAALKSEEGKASPGDKPKYTNAAAVCSGLVDSIKRGQSSRSSVMGTLRGQMKGGSLPGACN